MSDVFGFCIIGQRDEPLGPDQFCLEHRMLGIAPSWGRKGQKFIDGDWQPSIQKPAGYQYKPRFAVPTATPKTKAAGS